MSINSIGDRIKALRKEQKLTLKDLSEKVNISVSFLSDIENSRSKPSLERLNDIAVALGTTTSYLMGENENTEKKLGNQGLYEKLGLKVKEFRELSYLSREMLAKLSGVSLNEIIELEDNKKTPSSDAILKLTYALTVNLSEILDEANACENLKPSQKELIEESKNLTDEQIRKITDLIKSMK